MKMKKKKRKRKVFLKKAMIGLMIATAILPLFRGLVPQQQASEVDPKLAQAYLEAVSQNAEEAAEPEIEGRYEVIDVLDDTSLLIDYKGKQEVVELSGIKSAGLENEDYLARLLSDNFVDLEFDTVQRSEDGNLLAYVYLEDGRFLNQELLLSGYSVLDEETENRRYETQLKDAQENAQARNAGFWESTQDGSS